MLACAIHHTSDVELRNRGLCANGLANGVEWHNGVDSAFATRDLERKRCVVAQFERIALLLVEIYDAARNRGVEEFEQQLLVTEDVACRIGQRATLLQSLANRLQCTLSSANTKVILRRWPARS